MENSNIAFDMSRKYMKRVTQYLDELHEERDELFENVGKLINIADQQGHAIVESDSEKKTLQTFLRKSLLLFSEINNLVLKNLETCPYQESLRSIVDDHVPIPHIATLRSKGRMYPYTDDFCEYYPQVVNNSDTRRPLNDNTIINKSECTNNSDAILGNNESLVTTNCLVNNGVTTGSLMQQNMIVHRSHSPTFSHSTESVSSIASVSHPSMKVNAPTEIPQQYDTRDLDMIKENMRYFSKKMGFGSDEFTNLTNHFDKVSTVSQCQHVEPPSMVLNGGVSDTQVCFKEEKSSTMPDMFEVTQLNKAEGEVPGKLNNGTSLPDLTEGNIIHNCMDDDATKREYVEQLNNSTNRQIDDNLNLATNQIRVETSQNTGAIRKHVDTQVSQSDPSEASTDNRSYTTNSELSSQLKVSSWLTYGTQGNREVHQDSAVCAASGNGNAVEKLARIKRLDQNEEARKIARADMPDLKFVAVRVPKVIKNDLKSDTSSVKTSKTSKTNKKVKDLNKERSVYEELKVELPQIDSTCVFSHIISPTEFYIQILTETLQSQLDIISRSLNELYGNSSNNYTSKQNALAKLGKFCSGLYYGSSIEWFRFKVLDWKMDSQCDEVDVQSVDYGFKCTIPYTSLRQLPLKLAHIPVLAIKCHFPLLYPPGSTYSNRLSEWPLAVTEALYDIANISRDPTEAVKDPSIFVIVFSNLDGDSLAVDLGYYTDLTQFTLGMQLVDMGLAKEIIDDYADNVELGEFLEDVDELERAENLNEFIWGYDAKDEARICRFTRNDGSCFKGQNCKLEHILLKDGYTTDKSTLFDTPINDPILPKKLETVVVSVTVYIDSCTYLVQVIRDAVTNEECNIVMDKSVSELMDALNRPKKVCTFEHFKVYPSQGEVILALHPIDKKWMRVLVHSLKRVSEEVTIEVHSVDFGDRFHVNLKNARVMQEDFMHLPFQTVQIFLDKYQHRAGCDERKARRFFSRHMEYKTFLAHIMNDKPPFKVSLTTFKGCDIGPTLVNEGFAEKRTVALDMSENEIKRGHLDPE